MGERKITRSLLNLNNSSDEQLQEWANDPKTANPEDCLNTLQSRRDREVLLLNQEQERLLKKRQALEEDPFDPRAEVSADARKIVKNLWIIFVLLPFVIGILFVILTSK